MVVNSARPERRRLELPWEIFMVVRKKKKTDYQAWQQDGKIMKKSAEVVVAKKKAKDRIF